MVPKYVLGKVEEVVYNEYKNNAVFDVRVVFVDNVEEYHHQSHPHVVEELHPLLECVLFWFLGPRVSYHLESRHNSKVSDHNHGWDEGFGQTGGLKAFDEHLHRKIEERSHEPSHETFEEGVEGLKMNVLLFDLNQFYHYEN